MKFLSLRVLLLGALCCGSLVGCQSLREARRACADLRTAYATAFVQCRLGTQKVAEFVFDEGLGLEKGCSSVLHVTQQNETLIDGLCVPVMISPSLDCGAFVEANSETLDAGTVIPVGPEFLCAVPEFNPSAAGYNEDLVIAFLAAGGEDDGVLDISFDIASGGR